MIAVTIMDILFSIISFHVIDFVFWLGAFFGLGALFVLLRRK